MEIKVFKSAVDVSRFVVGNFIDVVKSEPRCGLGLATGRTMDAIYHHLVQKSLEEKIDYSTASAFAVDEYIGLREGSENSFEFYLNLHLFNKLNFTKENIYIPKTDIDRIDENCIKYEAQIQKVGIDLQVLGIGRNGHIGLNEPGSGLDSQTRIVALTSSTRKANRSSFGEEILPQTAVTMGVGTILSSEKCLLVATGETKAEIIQKLVNGDVNSKLPASAIKTHKNSFLILDSAAAKLI